MRVKVKRLGLKDKSLDLPEKSKIKDVLKRLEIDSDTIVVRVGNEIVTEDKPAPKEIEIIDVISGG